MAQIARATDASIDTSTAMVAPQVPGLIAGAAIDVCAPCYVASDGKVYMSNGTAVNAAAGFLGFAAKACPAGQAVTLFGAGTRMRYGTGLTPGANYFLDTTAGRLNDVATTGGTYVVAKAVDTTDIVVAATPR